MPELPDLEVFSSNLQKKLKGKKVKTVIINEATKINVPAAKLKKQLQGKTLKSIYREGKELRFAFSDSSILGIHLMLHGKLYWIEDTPKPNTLLQIDFGQIALGLTDFQKAANLKLDPQESDVPDALSANLAYLKDVSQSKAAIKNLLLDQKVVRGIGNAYADEILWHAGISPFSIARAIPPAKVKSLATAIKTVLKNAEKQVKKAEPDIIGGEVRDFLSVHNSKRKESPDGEKILQKTIGGRKTYYTKKQETFK